MAGNGACSPVVEDLLNPGPSDRSVVMPIALSDGDQTRAIGREMSFLATSVFEKNCKVSLVLLSLLLLHH